MLPLLLALLLATPPSLARPSATDKRLAAALAARDAQGREQIAAHRAKAEASGQAIDVLLWLTVLLSYIDAGAAERGGVNWDGEGAPAVAAASAAATKEPVHAPALLGNAARVAKAFGRLDEAGPIAERAVLAGPTQDAMGVYLAYWSQKDPAQLTAKCKAARKAAKDDLQRFVVLDGCMAWSQADTVATGLAWASSDDRAFYEREVAARDQRAEARAARHRAETQALLDHFERGTALTARASDDGAAAPASTASPTSVTALITCKERVRVYRGSTSGSGTYGWESPNSQVSYSLSSGHQICVSNGSDQWLSCWSPSGQTSARIEIGCGGISAR